MPLPPIVIVGRVLFPFSLPHALDIDTIYLPAGTLFTCVVYHPSARHVQLCVPIKFDVIVRSYRTYINFETSLHSVNAQKLTGLTIGRYYLIGMVARASTGSIHVSSGANTIVRFTNMFRGDNTGIAFNVHMGVIQATSSTVVFSTSGTIFYGYATF